jgi:hypothetical protein
MTRYAKRKLKYLLNENFNLIPYVEWDRFVTLTGAQAEWGLRNCIYIILFTSKLGAQVAQWVRTLDLTTHTSLSPIRHGFALGFVNYKKGCIRLAAASDKVYQLLAHGRCNENFNLIPYVEWDRFVTLTGAQAEWGLRNCIYIMATSFSGGGSRREPPTMGKLIIQQILYQWNQ